MSESGRYRARIASRRAAAGLVLAALMLVASTPASAAPSDKSLCRRADFRVVIDVGHTAEVPGALSARGIPEYEFNLSLARWIERALIAAGFKRAMRLITNGRAREGLRERVADANRMRADLFLSIHHDSVPDRFLETWEHEGKELNFSDRFKGHSIFVSNAHRERTASLLFAHLLGLRLKASGLRYTPHYTRAEMGRRRRQLVDADAGVYRYDRLVVLRATRMPAVLFEAGSIINRDEELKVDTPERKALVAAAVTHAVEQFCAARTEQAIARRKRGRPTRAARPGGLVRPAGAASIR